MSEPTLTYGLYRKSPSQGSHKPVRAKYYPVGDSFTVIVVEDGKHYFCDTTDRASAEALVRLVER